MLLEWPQSAFTLMASANAYIASNTTTSALRKNAANFSASARSSSLCSESVVYTTALPSCSKRYPYESPPWSCRCGVTVMPFST